MTAGELRPGDSVVFHLRAPRVVRTAERRTGGFAETIVIEYTDGMVSEVSPNLILDVIR